ncbi:hypothetical protein [Christiangramia sp.]|uniref:hypothetical protein n=1 Tax=Christiangramia sp. TaxID=1931228 RepID=UPI002609EFED|nr:hypothetical protein [Christiangramia sp.]
MFKQNSGCGIYGLIFCLLGGFILALEGNFLYLIYLICFITIPLLFIWMMKSAENKGIQEQEKKEGIGKPLTNRKSRKEQFTIKEGELRGALNERELPENIKNLTDLEKIHLTTLYPIELSKLINQNSRLRYISLSGPFWFKNNIGPGIQELLLYDHDNIDKILNKIDQQRLYTLVVSSNRIDVQGLIRFVKNLNSLTISCGLKEFPYELLNLKKLQYLDLSKNQINNISKKSLQRTDIQGSNLKALYLSENNLKTLPLSFFYIKTLKYVHLKGNPLKKRILKELQRNFSDKVILSYSQKEMATRTFHPRIWFALKVLLSLIIVLFPIIVFGSFVGSVLIGIVVWSAWRV